MADRHDQEHRIPTHEPPHGNVGHEVRDVNAWAIGRFGIGLVLLCIFAIALLFGLFRYFESTFGGPTPEANLNEDARTLPPSPTLETNEPRDLQRFHEAEDQVLNSYSWIDREHGIVHVPINVAIDMLAQKGLPSRQQAPVTDQVDVPTDSGLGPIMQQPGGPLAAELNGTAAPVTAAAAQSGAHQAAGKVSVPAGSAAPAEKK